jgi:hypothetical protein
MLRTYLPLLLLGSLGALAAAQTADFPGGRDIQSVARPANSFLIGAMHIDNDEYFVPVGPVEQRSTKLGKTVKVTGPVDTLVYAGPKTASSLTTYTGMASQLKTAGYTEVWSCARATCGGPYDLVNLLAQPLVDSLHEGSWAGWIIDDLYTNNSDVRYGAFQKNGEYVIVVGVLAPGKPSGALVIRANGPATDSALAATT